MGRKLGAALALSSALFSAMVLNDSTMAQTPEAKIWTLLGDSEATYVSLGEAEFRALETPVLVMVGDEDDHCLQPGLFLKRTIKRAALAVFPKSGHTLNLE